MALSGTLCTVGSVTLPSISKVFIVSVSDALEGRQEGYLPWLEGVFPCLELPVQLINNKN